MVIPAAPASGWRISKYPVTPRIMALSRYTKNPPQVQVCKAPTSHTTPLMASTQPKARIEKVVAVWDLTIQAAPNTISRMPANRNQAQDFLTSSMPASNKLDKVFMVLSPSPVVSTPASFQCMNVSGAPLGTDIGVADFGSGLNFPKTEEFWRKCCSRALTRFWSLGWSDNSCGISLGSALLKSWKSHTNPHGLYPVCAQMSEPVRSARDSASRE